MRKDLNEVNEAAMHVCEPGFQAEERAYAKLLECDCLESWRNSISEILTEADFLKKSETTLTYINNRMDKSCYICSKECYMAIKIN